EISGNVGRNPSEETVSDFEGGDNLLSPLANAPAVAVMVDWSKLHISNSMFSSYTVTGISSRTVTFKPFVLKSSKTYMLAVSLASQGNLIGKSQLYFTVNEMPQKMTCQMQPKDGFEVYTVFSIFCTSGKEDLYYEFSYRVGSSSRKMLYKGRDIQYYFNLPSGDPADGYKVTVFTQITNRFGSQTQPCPVNVTVLPSFLRNTYQQLTNTTNNLPEWELYHASLKNLSTLVLMGNHVEIRNYVILVTKVLNRLYTEERRTAFELQSKIRNALISSICSLSFQDQVQHFCSV
ncbi:hypothetical protein FKM82_026151, partial [Ascaphus truei]